MFKIISEATIIGFIVLLLGRIIMSLTLKKKDKKYLMKINIAFFLTGFILHFIIEYLGINCWYCDKKCASRICNFTG